MTDTEHRQSARQRQLLVTAGGAERGVAISFGAME